MSPIKYYLVSFLTYTDAETGWKLDLSGVAGWYPGKGWHWGSPQDLVTLFKALQDDGATVLLSFGGATFLPHNVVTASNVDALAQAIAYSFLGGTEAPPPPFDHWQRAFDSNWHFDGLDLDLEVLAGPPAINPSLWVTFAKSIKKYAPAAKLTGAPQSPYLYNNANSPFGAPFPTGAADSCSHISEPISGDFLLSTTNISLFDALFFQFYNQFGALDFPTEKNFPPRVCQFKKLIDSVIPEAKQPQLFVGVAAQGQGTNGQKPGIYDPTKISEAINSALKEAGGTNTSTWFGGVMGWQSPFVNQLVPDILAITGGAGALYGYQRGNPKW